MAGTDLPRSPDPAPGGSTSPVVYVDEVLTTGKAAAQAAHAAWMLVLDAASFEAPARPTVRFVDAARLAELSEASGALSVRDAGLTEVAAGSLTAVAFRRGA